MFIGSYEAEELGLMRRFLWTGQTIIDAGANIGYTARFFAGAVGETGKFTPLSRTRLFSPCSNKTSRGSEQVKTFNLGSLFPNRRN